LKVFYEGTDDLADIYDEDGTQLEQPAILDSDGRALGLFVDSSRVYRLEVYDRFGALIYTVRKMTPVGGGAGSAMGNRYNIVSSDGTLIVDEFDDAGVKTFDLSTHVTDGSDLMEWVAATGSTLLQGGIYRANYVDGTMEFGDRGVIMEGGRYYHVTLHMEALKNELSPVYDDVVVHLRGRDRDTGDVTEYTAVKYIVDYSMGMSQVFEVSADIFPQTNIELLVVLDGNDVAANTFSIVDMDVHRVYSGAPYIPGGVASKPWIADHYQETLVAGDNIIIDGNTISATAAPQVNADWDSNSGVTEILNKPDLSVYAEKTELEDYQEKLIPGSGITIEDNVITATAAQQLNADWDATSGVQEILNKPDLSVYAEKSELADYQEKLTAGDNITIVGNTISATAAPQQNADWDATSGVQEILHKPDLSIYAQSSSLSTVATTGNYDDLTNKPTIVTPVNADWDSTSGLSQILNKPSEKTLVAGENVTITESGDQVTISASGGEQVNADWDATSGVAEILHKPDLSIYAQSSSLATVATSGSYNDLIDKPTIPAALSAGNGIDITSNTVSVDLDGSTLTNGANGLSVTLPVPTVTSSDDGKVLTADYTGGVASYSWETPSAGGSRIVELTVGTSTWADFTAAYAQLTAGTIDGIRAKASSAAGDYYADLVYVVKSFYGGIFMAEFSVPVYNINNGGNNGKRVYSIRYELSSVGWTTTNIGTLASDIVAGTGISVSTDSSHNIVVAASDPLPAHTSTESGKVLSVDSTGATEWVTPSPVPVTDVEVDGVSVVSSGVASITMPTFTQQQVDWEATSGVAEILHKPDLSIYAQSSSLSTVATTGSYDDLLDKPTIVQPVNADWDATSGLSQILNKPEETTLTAGENISIVESGSTLTISATAAPQQQVDWDATSGITSIANKPDLSIYAQSANLATVATTGDYADLSNTPTIPAAQVNSDWDATSGVSEILNKPDLVDIVAGPGIVVDNPDGNTLRVSTDENYETVLYDGALPSFNNTITLSEPLSNFEYIDVSYSTTENPYITRYATALLGASRVAFKIGWGVNYMLDTWLKFTPTNDPKVWTYVNNTVMLFKNNDTSLTIIQNDTTYVTTSRTIRIVGIHRIANN
jgi:hypothetical protein